MAQYAPLKRQIVLVVEDEPILGMAALDMVETAGFEAVEATDATDAIRILEACPDIRTVFTDAAWRGRPEAGCAHPGALAAYPHYRNVRKAWNGVDETARRLCVLWQTL